MPQDAYRFVGHRTEREGRATAADRSDSFRQRSGAAQRLHARFVPSPYAAARLVSIDATEALRLPGVVAVLTARDLPVANIKAAVDSRVILLALDNVLHVGQPVAVVLAETEAAAEDGSVDLTGTTFAMITAEAFGLDNLSQVPVTTDHAGYAGGTGGSKITYTVGPAVKRAAEDARDQVLRIAAADLEVGFDDLEISNGRVSVKGVRARSRSLKEIFSMSAAFGLGRAGHADDGELDGLRDSEGLAGSAAEHGADQCSGRTGPIRRQGSWRAASHSRGRGAGECHLRGVRRTPEAVADDLRARPRRDARDANGIEKRRPRHQLMFAQGGASLAASAAVSRGARWVSM
jgi:hypothetical protein